MWFSILINKLAFFFELLFFGNSDESSNIAEPVGKGVEFLVFVEEVPNNDNISNHKDDILVSNNL